MMIGIFRKLLGLCNHKWIIIKRISTFETEQSTIPNGYKYVLQCENCGKIKTIKI